MAMNSGKPNYFLAVRLSEDISQALEGVCSRMVQFNPRIQNICTPTDEFHLTLCLLAVDDRTQLHTAIQALLDAGNELKSQHIKCKRMQVSGMSTFNGKVVYANIDCGRDFLILRSIILSFMDAAGVTILDNEFKPHVTVAKVTKAFTCKEGETTVDSKAYAKDRKTVFGEQTVDNICLCKMGTERQTDGFYVTEASIQI